MSFVVVAACCQRVYAEGALDLTKPFSRMSRRRHLYFYQDDGGFRATGASNEPLDDIYYLGVIDILTYYDVGKRFENLWKSVTQDARTISAVNAVTYGKRFLQFISTSIA